MTLQKPNQILIEKLEISNLKQHKEKIVEFSAGKNAIVGKNGAGKSTLFDAIMFSFFGIFPGKLKNEDFIYNKLTRNKFFTIQMIFTLNYPNRNTQYSVEREWGPHRNPKAVLRDLTLDKVYANGQTNVNSAILNLLALDKPETFENIVMANQKAMAGIINLTKTERKRFFEKILNITELGQMEETARSFVKNVGNKMEDFQYIKENHQRFRNELEKAQADLEQSIQIQKTYQKQLKQNEKKIKEEDAKFKKMEEQERQILSAKSSLDQITVQINRLEQEKKQIIGQIEDADISELKNVDMLVTEKIINTAIKKINTKKSQLSTEIESLNYEIVNASARNEKILNQKNLISQKKKDMASLKKNLQSIEKFVTPKKFTEYADPDFRTTRQKEIELILETLDKAYFEKYENLSTKIFEISQNLERRQEQLHQSPVYKIHQVDTEEGITALFKILSTQEEQVIKDLQDLKVIQGQKQNIRDQEKKRITELQRVQGQCPLCHSDISSELHTELLQEAEDTIKNLLIALKKIEESQGKLSKKQSQLKNETQNLYKFLRHVQKFDNQKETLHDYEKELTQHIAQYETLIKKYEYLQKFQKFDLHQDCLEFIEDEEQILLRIDEFFHTSFELKDLEKELKIINDQFIILCKENETHPLKKLQKSLSDYTIELDLIKSLLNLLSNLRATLQNIDFQVTNQNKLAGQLQKLNQTFDMKNYQELKGILDNLKTNYASLQANLSTIKTNIIPIKEENITRIQSELLSATLLLKKYEEMERQLEFARVIHEVLEIYRPTLLEKKIRAINDHTTALFTQFFSNSGFNEIKIHTTGKLEIVRDGHPYKSQNLSGGEQTICGLAMRVAIVKAIADYDLILLDEPTDALDEENREELLEFLQRQIPVNQIILISHYVPISNAADHTIEI